MSGRVLIIAAGIALITAAQAQSGGEGAIRCSLRPSVPTDPAKARVQERMDRTILPTVNFNKTDIADVIRFLNVEGDKYDPAHHGFHIRLDILEGMSLIKYHREVTIQLENAPLSDVLGYVIQQTNLHYDIGENEIVFRPTLQN